MAVVKNLMVRAGADFSGLSKATNQAQKSLNQFQKDTSKSMSSVQNSMSNVMGKVRNVLLTFGAGMYIKNAINDASNLRSALVGLNSVVTGNGLNISRANKYIQSYVKDGLVPLTNAVTAYKNLAARGYNEDQIEKTMSRLKDSASFGRQASLSMGEAISGATEGLKNENSILVDNAGVTKNVSRMWDDYAKSIGKTRNELSQHEKIQAEVNGIMTETRFQVGDAAKYANEYAGKMSALKKVFFDLSVNIGNIFIPIIMAVVPILTSVITKISSLAAMAANFMQALFGGNSDNHKQNANAATSQAQAVSGISDAYDEAGKSAKAANKSLAGFDELNVLSKNSSSAEEPGAGPDIPAVKDATGTEGVVSKIGDKMRELAETVSSFFKPIIEWFSKDFKPAFLNALSGAITFITPILEGFKPLAMWLWNDFLKPLSGFVADATVAALNAVGDALRSIGNWMSENQGVISGVVTTLTIFFGLWKLTELMAFIQMSGGLIGAFTAITTAVKAATLAKVADKLETIYLTGLYAKDFLLSIIPSTLAIKEQIIQWIALTAAKVANAVQTAILTTSIWLYNAATTIGTALTTAFGVAIAFLTSPIGLVILAIAALIAIGVLLYKNWDTVKEYAGKAWEGIKSAWGAASNWFNGTIVDPIKNAFVSMWDTVSSKAASIWESMKSGFRSFINFVIDGINLWLKWQSTPIDLLIKGLNKIPGVDIKTVDFQIPHIPKLATGGIVGAGQLFIANEAGPELIGNFGSQTGVMNNSQIVDSVSQGVFQAVKAAMGNNQSRSGDIIIQMGNTEFGRFAINEINKITKQEGRIPLFGF